MRKIGNIVSTILIIILIAFAGILYVPKFFGITPMVVLSGSMEPTYHVGSLIFVDKVDGSSLEVGDKATFYLGESKTVVTHRIVEKNTEEQYYITKGDNNDSKDNGKLSYSKIVGKAKDLSIPYFGYIATYLNTTSGFILLVGVAIVILLLSILLDAKTKKKGDVKNG